ncbi:MULTISPECIES: PEP-CTERM sorting domain-containing protein [Roseateles]|uniref:PEP-CTERM sorting domain-containing protein n=1 Tax=Pelomonas caseinilytica TaxID=2906763 RepID=A0ABS8XJ04_9BURK|nr:MULTISPECIES: PEP-CTERM sorting domain-containing protein [unclassified Roseateles]MCE4539245.1 PEP-CTERM sorting domain-containing protein [Pelomonas sp. P7]HEV6965001.1 PEP-CTERM sorting domain-containing protein [Roseateles sp.]
MKLATLALALGLASPAFAAGPLSIDFEKNWSYGEEVANAYADQGVTFTNVLGVSNDANFTYFGNAPSPLGVAFAQLDGTVNTSAFMNVAGGVTGGLSFFYSTPSDAPVAVKAYSGLNGTGTLLGTIDLTANSADYSAWNKAVLSFSGTAMSFDLTGTANVVALDNIAAVPEPSSVALLLAGGALLIARRRRS